MAWRDGTAGGTDCGEGGIRTHDTVAGIPPFQGGQFNRSCTSPFVKRYADFRSESITGASLRFKRLLSASLEIGVNILTFSKNL